MGREISVWPGQLLAIHVYRMYNFMRSHHVECVMKSVRDLCESEMPKNIKLVIFASVRLL